jgi:hypothetical protein
MGMQVKDQSYLIWGCQCVFFGSNTIPKSRRDIQPPLDTQVAHQLATEFTVQRSETVILRQNP